MGEENSQIVLIFVVSAAFVVLLAILLVLFLVIYQKRIVNQEIKLQRLENEQQQILLKATIEGQERERQRLAKDLHDGIGSLLTGLSLHLKFHRDKQKPNSETSTFLGEASEIVKEGIENVRSVSHNLLPSTLESFGLIAAIKECIAPFKKTSQLDIQVDIINDPYVLSKEISLGLLRVFQELIQNTIKHSNASKASISIEYHSDVINMNYNDNGKGIDMKSLNSDGIGIINMQSRVQALEGTFKFNPENNIGIEVNIAIPILRKSNKS